MHGRTSAVSGATEARVFHYSGRPIVTTSLRPDPAAAIQARGLADRIGGVFIGREGRPLSELLAGGCPVVVVQADRVVCHQGDHPFFFHPGLTRMRMRGGPGGRVEPLIEALQVSPGDRVLDATLGRAGDAILISHEVGAEGRIVGLEASPVVAEIIRLGLATAPGVTPEIEAAMRRIEVVCARHEEYLAGCADGSFDVVYFDPMFDLPLSGSTSIEPLRPLACHDPLVRDTIEQAARVARRRVVIKSRKGSALLDDLGIKEISGGTWSRLAYGIVRTGEG